jgi:hypothetical protein
MYLIIDEEIKACLIKQDSINQTELTWLRNKANLVIEVVEHDILLSNILSQKNLTPQVVFFITQNLSTLLLLPMATISYGEDNLLLDIKASNGFSLTLNSFNP